MSPPMTQILFIRLKKILKIIIKKIVLFFKTINFVLFFQFFFLERKNHKKKNVVLALEQSEVTEKSRKNFTVVMRGFFALNFLYCIPAVQAFHNRYVHHCIEVGSYRKY